MFVYYGSMLPDFKQHYKAMLIKRVQYWTRTQAHKSMEQNREPRNKPTRNLYN